MLYIYKPFTLQNEHGIVRIRIVTDHAGKT